MKNKWHEIWEKRSTEKELHSLRGGKELFLELKRLDGWDSTGEMLTYEQFNDQYIQINNELSFSAKTGRHEIKSIFEVGCGAGPNLYLYQQDGLHVGGIDYSHSLIDIAKTVLKDPVELICDEAINLPDTITYDAVLSNSVFSYFDSYEYAEAVLERMYRKTNFSIGIIDIHDAYKKVDFIEYRKQIDASYEERYKELPKFFYDKAFFLRFAESHNMNIRFSMENMGNYWNSDFVFQCYMTKN